MRYSYLPTEEIEEQAIMDAWTEQLSERLSNKELRIQVKKQNGDYEVVNGRHRLGVALIRGLERIPVEFVV